jgi:hypothetical protein
MSLDKFSGDLENSSSKIKIVMDDFEYDMDSMPGFYNVLETQRQI